MYTCIVRYVSSKKYHNNSVCVRVVIKYREINMLLQAFQSIQFIAFNCSNMAIDSVF